MEIEIDMDMEIEHTNKDIISNLPTELIFLIMSFLSVSSRVMLMIVSRRYLTCNKVYEEINFPLVSWNCNRFYRRGPYTPKERRHIIITDIVCRGYTDLFKRFDLSRFYDTDLEEYCKKAAELNSFDILIHAYRDDLSDSTKRSILISAVRGGHYDIIRWLRTKGCPWDNGACCAAVECGRFDVLKWLRENGCSWAGTRTGTGVSLMLSYSAVENGRLDILKYLSENGCYLDSYTCCLAAENGHLEILKYLHDSDCPLRDDICSRAAKKGHFEILKYLHDNGCPWNQITFRNAVEYGDMEIVKYLLENGCPMDERACESAALYGHFDILKYLHDNGCPWDESTTICAELNDRTEMLEYLQKVEKSK